VVALKGRLLIVSIIAVACGQANEQSNKNRPSVEAAFRRELPPNTDIPPAQPLNVAINDAASRPVPEGCTPSAYPFKYWCTKSRDGIQYSMPFSHRTEDRHDEGAVDASGTYCLNEPVASARITQITFRCDGCCCGWNYNPSGGYGQHTTVEPNQACFGWKRKWDGKPVTETYTAFYEKLEEF
jgi:hypothetical protein